MNTIGVNGAVLQMFAHGVMTALMFTNVGAVYDQAHTRDMTEFGGMAKQMPRHSAFFAIAGLSSLGLAGPGRLRGGVPHLRRRVPGRLLVGRRRWASSRAAITATYILRMLAQRLLRAVQREVGGA